MKSAVETALRVWILVVMAVALAACGGGGGATSSVTTLSASGLRFGGNMVVTVNGSGLDDPQLSMTVAGPCDGIVRSSSSDSQTVFSCRLTGTGQIEPQIRNQAGLLLASVRVNVPTPQVTMTVSQGSRSGAVLIELDANAAPVSARNFLEYVNSVFYTGTLFHRVLPGRIAQGGGYTAGPVVKRATFAAIRLESANGLKNLRGTIAMARTEVPNSATSQFYFNLKDNPEFDFQSADLPGYAVFGRVISGLESVVDEIGKVPVETRDNEFSSIPVTDVIITAASQTR